MMPAGTFRQIQPSGKPGFVDLFSDSFNKARVQQETNRHNTKMESFKQKEQDDKVAKIAKDLADKKFSDMTIVFAMIDKMKSGSKANKIALDTILKHKPYLRDDVFPRWQELVKQDGLEGELISKITKVLDEKASVSSSDIRKMGEDIGASAKTIEEVTVFKDTYLSEQKAETAKETAAAVEARAVAAAKRAVTAEQRAEAEEMRKKAEELRKIEKHEEDMKTGGKGTGTSEDEKRDKIFKLTVALGERMIAMNEGKIKEEKNALTIAVTPLLDNIHTSIKNNYIKDGKITSAGKEAFVGKTYEIISNQEFGELFRKGRGNSIENTTSFIFSGNSAGSAQGEDVGDLVNQTHVAVPKNLLDAYRKVKGNLAPLLDSLTRQNSAIVEIYRNQIAEINGPAKDIEPLTVGKSSANATSAPPDSSIIDQVKSADWFTGITGAHADIVRKVILDKIKKNPSLTIEQIRQELKL